VGVKAEEKKLQSGLHKRGGKSLVVVSAFRILKDGRSRKVGGRSVRTFERLLH